MNILIPQTYAAMAEVKELMRVQNCILTPQSNKPVMGLVQDSLLMNRILTSKSVFLDIEQVFQIVGFTTTFQGENCLNCF
jgi:DNA-directed RNA polymerase II subunit RPB1